MLRLVVICGKFRLHLGLVFISNLHAIKILVLIVKVYIYFNYNNV